MKKQTITLLLGLLVTSFANFALAQGDEVEVVRVNPTSDVSEEVVPNDEENLDNVTEGSPDVLLVANTQANTPAADAIPSGGQVAVEADQAQGQEAGDPADAGEPAVAEAGEVNPIEEEEGGFLIKDANINDIFQLLAKRAGKQYFHNNKINTEDYKVTGHLNGDVSSLKQMEELAFQYGLRMYVKGNTIYAMMDEQLNNLPAKEWTYSLKYLRPTDIEQIKALIQPMLTTGRGIVNYEPKTNTIIVIDTMRHIEMVEQLLRKIDKPKGQIVVEVKILRVNNAVGKNAGVDWSTSLGSSGVSFDVVRSLNSVFGLPENSLGGGDSDTSGPDFSDSNIILSPVQMRGVLRALNDSNLVSQKSNPVVITEDNEKASISLIDRVPIITQTTTDNGATTNVSEEVRYTIDAGDSTDPDTTREIGVTITMTPSLLPDGTIRMYMRPRNAQIVEEIKGASGNVYPRVSEATIQSIARIPNGHSLVIGGFYGESQSKSKNKVPLLGDIPLVNFFFKSKQTKKEQSSLVFVVTPTSYNPACVKSNGNTSDRLRKNAALKPEYDWVEDENAGPAHEPNLRRTIRGMKPVQAPYYPQR